ncbi:cobyrinate a,c-diamide synthase [Halochromatium roseum]|uniref:cobyrinate a,c-diamide synthase n=1 Tax=Halochromatium roseum TaxID=391920 RepID=UPI0019129919|nr:cobyrinate a,c-diamide synthase [Halochromatium roseum]MBK5941741.1 cobyrinic acid a,c-diamide synthase [Halochromatium roseum]
MPHLGPDTGNSSQASTRSPAPQPSARRSAQSHAGTHDRALDCAHDRSPDHQCPALFLSATSSGQGKTTLTAALARHHRNAGRRVRVFKTGPDFLDPMILGRAAGAGTEAEPLDLWMVGEDDCRRALYQAAGEADLILVEGAMGLFDGSPSGADLAETFGLPVAALIDARGMGQTFGALALGLMQYRPGLCFAGIAANRVASARHAEMIRAGIPAGVPYLGALPRLDEAALPSRHLGLVQAQEIADLEQRLDRLAEHISTTELAALPKPVRFQAPRDGLAGTVPGTGATVPAQAAATVMANTKAPSGSRPLSAIVSGSALEPWSTASKTAPYPKPLAGRRIAIARDAAFSFLYAANLRLLAQLGAELAFFSPLSDQALDPADAIYLPGGYPELHLAQLAANSAIKAALRAHVDAGRPLYAECGGMLYLLEQLSDKQGQSAEMVGLLPGTGRLQPRLAGLGMQALAHAAGELRGHSFHHSTMSTPIAAMQYGIRQHDGQPGEPFYQQGPIRASYLHLYFPSAPAAAAALFLP